MVHPLPSRKDLSSPMTQIPDRLDDVFEIIPIAREESVERDLMSVKTDIGIC